MSVGKRITETIEKLAANDPEAAFLSVCPAVEATAKKEFPAEKSTGRRFKNFIHEHRALIGLIGLGIVANRMKLPSLHPDIKPAADGSCSIEDILYHAVRCGLAHEGEIASYVIFKAGVILGTDNGKYQLCDRLPLGMAVAVMVSPTNAAERLLRPLPIATDRGTFNGDDLWGKRDLLMQHLFAGVPG